VKPRPLCRVCGKLIAKRTDWLRFGCAPIEVEKRRGRGERPADKAEAQRYVNGEITKVEYSTLAHEDAPDRPLKPWEQQADSRAVRAIEVPRYVSSVTFWDGESYADPDFCSGTCAQAFGRAMARQFPGHAMPAYREARARRAIKEGKQ